MPLAVQSPVYSATHRVVAAKDERRQDVFCLLVKRTYDIVPGRVATRSAKDLPLLLQDEYFDPGDPENCSLRLENDLSPYKVATDVVIVGKAYAPGGKPAQVFDVHVDVAGVQKVVRVFGDRRCMWRDKRAPALTEPEPVATVDLQYERAYGGTDVFSIPDMPFSYPRNHLGRGFVLKNFRELVDGMLLPNFEDTADLLTADRIIVGEPDNWSAQPMPQGLGWFQKTWYPRCSFVGAVPGFVEPGTPLREEMLGLVPRDHIALARGFRLPSFDIRFNNGASAGLALPFLKGGEPIKLGNLTPESALGFTLPVDTLKLNMDIGFGWRDLPAVLQTVLIRPEERQVDLVWRGAHEFPGVDWLPEMKRLAVEIE